MKEHVLPAIRNMKDLEKLTQTDYKVCVLLDMHVGHLRSIIELLKKHDIEAYIHIDLIKGMAHDEYACEYIIQTYKPKGIVSTKTKVIQKAKSLNVLTIFRVFIIDSQALNRSIQLIKKVDPDYVEVLPGIAHKIVENVREATTSKIIAGGLIEEEKEVNDAINSGASYVTTSNRKLW